MFVAAVFVVVPVVRQSLQYSINRRPNPMHNSHIASIVPRFSRFSVKVLQLIDTHRGTVVQCLARPLGMPLVGASIPGPGMFHY